MVVSFQSKPPANAEDVQKQASAAPAAPLESSLSLRCPSCLQAMGRINPLDASARSACAQCGFVLLNTESIWRALAPDREERFRRFMREYQTVRSQEGRGSSCAEFYLALPYADLTGRNNWQWKIRARSFSFFLGKLLPEFERDHPRGLDVLDIGAGNGWMSFRLALKGHRPILVDLLDNAQDGLGAARHYFPHLPRPLPCIQAEMDRLPFGSRQFDLAVFNASFHYSENYERTLRETLRCLRPPGHVIILDSAFYNRDESGRRMVQERQAAFEKRFGFASDSIASREYLTQGTLDELARALSVSWRVLKPWYGIGWALRPFRARLVGRREPSKFFILWAAVLDS